MIYSWFSYQTRVRKDVSVVASSKPIQLSQRCIPCHTSLTDLYIKYCFCTYSNRPTLKRHSHQLFITYAAVLQFYFRPRVSSYTGC